MTPSIDWGAKELPKTWVDELDLRNPISLVRFVRHMFGERTTPVVPGDLPGAAMLPEYLKQEFHRMPNGNFSSKLARGYATSFDAVMLWSLKSVRRDAAHWLAGGKPGKGRALDLGCGSGAFAFTMMQAGFATVIAADANPYMLKSGAERFRDLTFDLALGEALPYEDQSFDAVGVCFLFHEVPHTALEKIIKEIYPVLKYGGRLAIIEPSPRALRPSPWSSPRTLYFNLLSRFVYEPHLADWHNIDPQQWLPVRGFRVFRDTLRVPVRILLAEKA